MQVQIGKNTFTLSDIHSISEVLVANPKEFNDNEGSTDDECDWMIRFYVHSKKLDKVIITNLSLNTTEKGLRTVRDTLYSMWYTDKHKLVILVN